MPMTYTTGRAMGALYRDVRHGMRHGGNHAMLRGVLQDSAYPMGRLMGSLCRVRNIPHGAIVPPWVMSWDTPLFTTRGTPRRHV